MNLGYSIKILEQAIGDHEYALSREKEVLEALKAMAAAQADPEGWRKTVEPGAVPLLEPVFELLKQEGNIIHAIKSVREITGMGLREAKDFVEQKWVPLLGK